MKTFLHGTSFESAMNIIKSSTFEQNEPETVFRCSEKDIMYFYAVNNDKNSSTYDECIKQSLQHAQTAAAYNDSKSDKLAIIEIIMRNETAGKAVLHHGNSKCSNEKDLAADCVSIRRQKLDELIKSGEVKCTVYIYEQAYVPYYRPYYLASVRECCLNAIDEPYLKPFVDWIRHEKQYIKPDDEDGGICNAKKCQTIIIKPDETIVDNKIKDYKYSDKNLRISVECNAGNSRVVIELLNTSDENK